MIAISKLTFLYNYHPVLSEIPHVVSLWRTRRACCASDITTLPFSWQIIEYRVNLFFILGCETWNLPMGRSRLSLALVDMWMEVRHKSKLQNLVDGLKNWLIHNTTLGGPKTTDDHNFYMGFKTGLFHSFQVLRGCISILSSAAAKPGNTLSLALRFSSW